MENGNHQVELKLKIILKIIKKQFISVGADSIVYTRGITLGAFLYKQKLKFKRESNLNSKNVATNINSNKSSNDISKE